MARLRGIFANTRYRQGDFQWQTKLYDYQLNSEKQLRDGAVHQERSRGLFSSVSHRYDGQAWYIVGSMAGAVDRLALTGRKSEHKWLKVGAQQSWVLRPPIMGTGDRVYPHTGWKEKHMDKLGKGYDVSAKLFGKALYIPMYLSYDAVHRQNHQLNLGGFRSALASSSNMVNTIFMPEIPFYAAQGERYEGYGGGIKLLDEAPWLYYQQNQLDGDVFSQSYGLKWSVSFNNQIWLSKFAPAGLSDFRFDAGLVRVEGDELENENRAWFGLWYEL